MKRILKWVLGLAFLAGAGTVWAQYTNTVILYGSNGQPISMPAPASWGQFIATCGGFLAVVIYGARIVMTFLPKGNSLIPLLKWVTMIKASDKHAEPLPPTDNGTSTVAPKTTKETT
jgi:hypothetical protein